MELKAIKLSEINKSDRERQIGYGIPYIWNLKANKTQTSLCKYREQMVVTRGGGEGIVWNRWKGSKGTKFQLLSKKNIEMLGTVNYTDCVFESC